MTETDTANVSRETSPEIGTRPYRSPARRHGLGTTRAALIEAVVAFAAEGNFRPKGADVAQRAGISQPQINHHFGSILGLYAAVARAMPKEISVAIADALDRATKADVDGEQLAWLVLVGCPMEAP